MTEGPGKSKNELRKEKERAIRQRVREQFRSWKKREEDAERAKNPGSLNEVRRGLRKLRTAIIVAAAGAIGVGGVISNYQTIKEIGEAFSSNEEVRENSELRKLFEELFGGEEVGTPPEPVYEGDYYYEYDYGPSDKQKP